MRLSTTLKSVSVPDEARKNVLFFSIEGAFFTFATTLGTNTNNLFLSRLGASDFQLSFFTMMAQALTMVMLVPVAIYTDRMKNKRKMLTILLGFIAASYLLGATAPFFGEARLYVLIGFVALAVSGVMLCTSTWQAFFADVTPPDHRNRTFAIRNQTMFVVNICMPLVAGVILNSIQSSENRVVVHQIYYCVIAAAAILSAVFLRRIRGGDVKEPSGKSFKEFARAVGALAHNKRFLFFAAVAFLFYTTWQMDGTIFYLGQVKYVGLSDFWYICSNVCCGLAQFLSIRFWAKRNEKMGVRFGLIFGAVGLVLSPLCIILPLYFEGGTRIAVHLVLRCMSDLTFATVTLNVLQNLLQVIEEKNRALSIAAYTILISLANAFSPFIGVSIYTALGANQAALIQTNFILIAVRLFALGGLIFRWWVLRKEPK